MSLLTDPEKIRAAEDVRALILSSGQEALLLRAVPGERLYGSDDASYAEVGTIPLEFVETPPEDLNNKIDAAASSLVQASTTDGGVVQPAAAANLTGGQDAQDTLRVFAVNEGVWGDRLEVEVEDGSLDPAGGFNLIVRYKGEVVEVFKDLSMDEAAKNHVELAINERSEFIAVEDLGPASGLPEDRPATGRAALSGGDDGLAGLDDADYTGDPS